jgi:hypothetical protein
LSRRRTSNIASIQIGSEISDRALANHEMMTEEREKSSSSGSYDIHTHYFVEWVPLENSTGKKIVNYKFEEIHFVFVPNEKKKYLMVYDLSSSHMCILLLI